MATPQPLLFINCTVINEETVNCNGSIFDLPEKTLTYRDSEFWIYLGIYVGLVLIAGLMSGLTMGLLSLDTTMLTVLQGGGKPKEQRYARRILPLIKRHHLLLVTLLLGNAAAVEAMPIFLDRISSPVIAIVVSVTAVLIFGEVIPQAICTRFGLAIGATLAPAVYVLMALLFVVAWPISKLLDCCLGSQHGTFYRRSELKALMDLHGPESHSKGRRHSNNSSDEDDEPLLGEEVRIVKGALEMSGKTVATAMIPISDVFMVDMDGHLDYETMTRMLTRGHSRIPVYAGHPSNVVALLLTKTLIRLNPRDATPISQVLKDNNCCREPLFVEETTPLYDLLNQFLDGKKSHMAFVRKSRIKASSGAEGLRNGDEVAVDDTQPLITVEDQPYEEPQREELIGLITLEDVIEEILQVEIEDESDVQKKMEMGALQVALAKVYNRNRNLHRSKSQPQNTGRLLGEGDDRMTRQISTSQDQSHMPRISESEPVQSDASPDTPIVTFE